MFWGDLSTKNRLNIAKNMVALQELGKTPNKALELIDSRIPKELIGELADVYFILNRSSDAINILRRLWTIDYISSEMEKELRDKISYFELETKAKNKFRDVSDINQYVFQLWQIYTGNFTPKSIKETGSFFNLSDDNSELFNVIDEQKTDVLCINDSNLSIDYEKATKELAEHFDKILPDKSSFEK